MANLTVGGVDCVALAKKLGTPLQIYDEKLIEDQIRSAMDGLSSTKFGSEVIYASKAFSCKAIYEKVKQMGAGLDVVSGGELYCASEAGMDMSEVYFHGNNKSVDELHMALMLGCNVVLDNLPECRKLIGLASLYNKESDVLLRVNPGIEAHTHEYIRTSGADTKFGIPIDRDDEIAALIKETEESPHINFRGFHSHIGSQITDTSGFEQAIEILVDFMKHMYDKYGILTDVLNIGGGFGIRYTAGDKPVPIGEMTKLLVKKCEDCLEAKGLTIEKLMIEPGRSIVGEAGYTLYTVGFSKDTGCKNFIFVDGGMSDNIRPVLYQAEYSCDIADRIGEPKDGTFTVAGKNCESGDILIKEASLPSQVKEGDILVMYSTGAYGYSMASNYNRACRPAVVFVKDGVAREVLREETYTDQMRFETDTVIEL